MTARRLRDASELLRPAVASALEALQLGPEDAGISALALAMATAIDAMDESERARMIGQTAPALLRVLEAADARARRRGHKPTGVPSGLEKLRAARAASDTRRRAGK